MMSNCHFFKNAYATLLLLLFSNILMSQNMEKQKADNVSATYGIAIDAPIEKVWAVLAVDFGGIGKWASGVNHSEGVGQGEGLEGATCSERACKINAIGFSNAKERIIKFDAENHILAYTIYEGVPGFVKNFVNQWTLEQRGAGTLVTARSTMRATGLMGWMMKGFMRSSTEGVLRKMGEELKHYVEKGEPHPRKVEAIAKFEKKNAKK